MHPPDPGAARVVELGCGDGGNLLAVAAARPGAEVVGFDAEPAAVQRGRELAAEAGLAHRVALHAADLRELGAPDVGRADYVVIHGLWSWVRDDVRDAALRIAAAAVADQGVVSLSYNALPGWHLWMAPRAIARRAAAGEEDPDRAAALAVSALAEAADLHGRDDVYGRTLAAAAERLRNRPPELVFHDDLADECTPFSITEVAGRARDHGLRYLGEALPEHWWTARVAAGLAQRVRAAGTDAVERQQAADLAAGVDFKTTLFVRETARPAAEPGVDQALALSIASRHDAPPLADGTAPAVRAMNEAVTAAGGLFRGVRDAGGAAGLGAPQAAGAALRLAAEGHARLAVRPPRVAVVGGDRPRAPRLARAQAARTERVATLLHEVVTLDDGVRALVCLLDGTVERASLPTALGADPAAVDAALVRLGEVGLLEA